jgi:hypothetical protein
MKRGKIIGLEGSWGSGIATLYVEDSNGDTIPLYCENSPTIKALDNAFGGVIAPGHRVNVDAIKGKIIYYSEDNMGMLEGFTTEVGYDEDF